MKAISRPIVAFLTCAMAGSARAGPDLQIAEIFDTFNTKLGTIGNITAYTFSTAFCNIGDESTIWLEFNNQHPVLGQNAYRFEVVDGAGRFEQIGLSWIKHGSCADPTPGLCGDCIPKILCDALDAGCEDVYTAGLNANQQFLGPRSVVDPFTGAFAYPFPTQGETGDVLYKRLQIANSDLDPALHPSASYFIEQQVITVDEAIADRFNNVSWREFVIGAFTNGGFDVADVGSTHAGAPAIEAWPLHDAGVALVNVDIPNDGRFVLVCKVTDLSPQGTWRYEYAIYNMNVHRAGGSFEVPIAPAVTAISNVGFHDIDYHSGEAILGDDWAFVMLPTSLQWSTDPASERPNANAIRWGTTYNFRFDADRAPFPGTVSMGLFMPGKPSVVQVSAMAPNPCECLGDVNGDGSLNGADIAAMVSQLLGQASPDPCADLAAPFGAGADLADSAEFVDRLLVSSGCP